MEIHRQNHCSMFELAPRFTWGFIYHVNLVESWWYDRQHRWPKAVTGVFGYIIYILYNILGRTWGYKWVYSHGYKPHKLEHNPFHCGYTSAYSWNCISKKWTSLSTKLLSTQSAIWCALGIQWKQYISCPIFLAAIIVLYLVVFSHSAIENDPFKQGSAATWNAWDPEFLINRTRSCLAKSHVYA